MQKQTNWCEEREQKNIRRSLRPILHQPGKGVGRNVGQSETKTAEERVTVEKEG